MRLLVVEDDPDLNRQLVAALEEAGYVVDSASDGEEGHFLGDTEPYDAVVLDLGLPEMDGVTVLEKWRRDGRTMPVLILTARDRWSDKVAGFDAGADDYVAKPFYMEEVLARLRALLRRATGHATSELECGSVRVDTKSSRVTVNGRAIKLRLVAGAALWSAIALVAGGLILSAIFRNSVERSFDSRLNVLLHSLIATIDISEQGEIERTGGLSETRFDLAYSGWYWQIWPVAPRPALRSRSLFDQSIDLSRAESVERDQFGLKIFDVEGPEGQPLRVVERRVTLPGYDVPVSFAVAGDRSEMDEEIQSFNTWLFVSMAAMGAGLLIALLIQVRFGLRPLERVRDALAQIRSGRVTRLDGEFPQEIEPLANELNSLLEGNREVIERARTHVGNLAHALKTPLSVLTNEARNHDGAFGETVRRATLQMREQIDRHLARARMAGPPPVGECAGTHSRRTRRLDRG